MFSLCFWGDRKEMFLLCSETLWSLVTNCECLLLWEAFLKRFWKITCSVAKKTTILWSYSGLPFFPFLVQLTSKKANFICSAVFCLACNLCCCKGKQLLQLFVRHSCSLWCYWGWSGGSSSNWASSLHWHWKLTGSCLERSKATVC